MLKTYVTLVGLVVLAMLAYFAYQGKYEVRVLFPATNHTCRDQIWHPAPVTCNHACHRHYFKDVMLIIIYNYPQYDSIPVLKKFYQPIFPNIFICGPKGKDAIPNITFVDIQRGILGYECISQAIRHHPGYEGYFYINDDVILNYWNLFDSKFDKKLIWRSNNQFGRISLGENITQSWYWWVSPYGFNNCKNALQEIKMFANNYKLYKDMYTLYIRDGNGSEYAYSGRSDILYIPRKYSMKFQELSRIFYKQKVFLEIAVPTMLHFLVPTNNISTLFGHYIPGDVRKNDPRVVDSRYFWSLYLSNPSWWFVHPFKLHHKHNKNKELNLALMKYILIRKTKELANCSCGYT